MSTKELYEAHALISQARAADKNAYGLVDEAIEKYIKAEQYLRVHLKGAYQYTAGSAPDEQDLEQIYLDRFKTVICKMAVNPPWDRRFGGPLLPDGSELDQLRFLAIAHDCPRAVWQ